MKYLKLQNGLNNSFNSTPPPPPPPQYAVNEALTTLFCIVTLLFLYACSSSDPSPIPPNTTTSHKVTFNPNTPSTSSASVSNLPAEQNVKEGDLATEPATPPTLDGYTFGGWYTEASTTTTFQFSTKITKATTLYAKWTLLQSFTITYHANRPSDAPPEATVTGVPENPVSISEGQTATAPTSPTLTGYDFAEWYTEEAATNPFDFSQVITASIDLYAKWTIQVFTVTYDANKPNGATAEVTRLPNPVMINYNLTTTTPRPAPALDGYTFEGWYTEQAATIEFAFTTPITANIDLYAKWTAIQTFTVTYHGNKPQDVTAIVTGVPENPESISEGQTATAPTSPTLAGYNFVAWYTEAAATNQFDFSQGITANIDLYAKWTQDPVVSFNMQGGSPIDPQTLTGTTKRATRPDNPAREDYTFDNWYTQATGGALFDFSQTITAQSTTVYARWNRIIRTITYNGNKPDTVPEKTTVSNVPAIANVNSGDMVAPPATPPVLQDYVFQGWFAGTTTGTILRLENTAFVFETTAIKADLLLYAKWTRTQITVIFHGRKPSTAPTDATITGLTTDPTIVTVNSGETTSALKPPPELTGYTLDGWFIGTISGGTLALQDTAFDFDQPIRGENINLYTKWLQQFTITYYGNKPSDAPEEATVTGVPENPVSIPDGQTATPPTSPTLAGYNFVAWYTEPTATNQFDFSQGITTSIDLYAKWSQDPVVTFDTQGGSNIMSQTITRPTTMASRPDNPAREDYTFDNWYTMATGGALFDFTANINASITVYARWNRIMRTITYHGNKPDTVPRGVSISNLPDPATVNVNSGDMATAPATPPELQDYVFQGWFAGTTTGTTPMIDNTAFVFETIAIKENKDLYAKWTRKEITITFYGNKPDSAPTDASITGLTTDPKIVTVNSGETTTALAPELTGYTLDGWFIGTISGDTLALQDTAFDFTTTIRGENINLYAKWTQDPVVTFDTRGGSPIEPQRLTGTPKRATRPDNDPTREDYTFDNWYTTADTGTTPFNFDQDITAQSTIVYARWNRITRTVTYHGNKPDTVPRGVSVSNIPDPATVNVDSGDTATAPTPKPELQDYVFQGWFVGTISGGTLVLQDTAFAFETTAIKENKDLYAKWTRKEITITFYGNKPDSAPTDASITGLMPNPKTVTVNSGETTTALAPELTGYTLDGWFIGTISGDTLALQDTAFDFAQPVRGENINLYAKWTKDPVVTFDTQGGSNVLSQTITAPTTMVTRPDVNPTREGYQFVNWYTMATGGDEFDFSRTITVSIIIYAQWIQEFSVTYHANKPSDAPQDATVTGVATTPETVNSGDRTSAPNDPTLTGYNFVGWYTDEATTNQFNFSQVITVNIDLYAKWTALQTFTVSYNANKPTGVTDNVMGVPTDVKVIINLATTEPSPEPTLVGYTFEGWYSEATATNIFDFSTNAITANIILYAKWTIQEFTVTYDVNKPSGATADVAELPDPVMINYNLATAEPRPEPTLVGYTFEGWYTEQATTTKFVFTTPITEDKTLYAKWVFRPSTKDALVAEINRAITDATPSPNLNYIDTSLINDMSNLFSSKADFNGNISEWNVSLVENMRFMFSFASAFNQNISSWNVSNVNNMSYMFFNASAFNQNMASWNVSLVKNMNNMLSGASDFNGNISNWNVSLVENMSFMFSGASSFNQNISSWNVAMVNNMNSMFRNANAFNQNISSWNVSEVTNMSSMFFGTTVFNGNISSWNVAMVTDMNGMFSSASAFNGDISGWNVSLVENMNQMFRGTRVFNQDLNNWNVAKVTNMQNMFSNARVFNQNISSWNVSEVTNMNGMFGNARVFNQNISSWNVAKVTDMSSMFDNAFVFNQNISSWNVSEVTNMNGMFRNARVFNQNISSWNVAKVTDMSSMFDNAYVFNQNISSWNVDMVSSFNAFKISSALSNANTPEKFR